MPPSFVALPPKQIMIRDIGNSRAFKINSPNPYKLAMINNQLQDPEKKKKLQEQLDAINVILKEEEK